MSYCLIPKRKVCYFCFLLKFLMNFSLFLLGISQFSKQLVLRREKTPCLFPIFHKRILEGEREKGGEGGREGGRERRREPKNPNKSFFTSRKEIARMDTEAENKENFTFKKTAFRVISCIVRSMALKPK